MKLTPLGIVAFFVAGGVLYAEPGTARLDPIVEHYVWASDAQQARLNGASMEVEIQAAVPKLRKRGHLHALRHISRLGRITYDALRFDGDRAIKTDVIARYLNAEIQASESRDPSLAIRPANYKFRYKAQIRSNTQNVYVYQLTPRRKRAGLFKGEIWIDAATYLPVRESGRFVKSPSIFVRDMEFVREYEIVRGVAVPKHIRSRAETRVVGQAELTVDFNNYSIADDGDPVASLGSGSQ